MISVQEATRIILEHAGAFGEEAVPLAQATGRVLREDLLADRDFPPFTRVSMDGIAIRYAAFARGVRTFAIRGKQAAGEVPRQLDQEEACLEVMTGAVLPDGADTVIRYEDLEISDSRARILTERVGSGQNAHPQGYDRTQGSCIVPAGALLSPAEIGIAATVGKDQLRVIRRPRVIILYTGDELVPVTATPQAHQIRASNGYTIHAALQRWGVEADQQHLPDDPGVIRDRLETYLSHYDALILSGGVSKGRFDFIPDSLAAQGVERLFHQVAQKPGKPFWFGRHPGGTTVFAFPGNPIPAFMCTLRYFQPWLRHSLGLPAAAPLFAALAEDVVYKKKQTYFLTVKVQSDPASGRLVATPLAGKGSGDLANLADADGFLELPPDEERFAKGHVFPVYLYRGW